jgi:hypothetical protein
MYHHRCDPLITLSSLSGIIQWSGHLPNIARRVGTIAVRSAYLLTNWYPFSLIPFQTRQFYCIFLSSRGFTDAVQHSSVNDVQGYIDRLRQFHIVSSFSFFFFFASLPQYVQSKDY